MLLSEVGRLLLEVWGFGNVREDWKGVPLALQLLTSHRLSLKSEVEVEVSELSKVFRTASAGLTSPVSHR